MRRAWTWPVVVALAFAGHAGADEPDPTAPAAISLALGFDRGDEPEENPAKPEALAALVTPDAVVSEVSAAERDALFAAASACVGGRAPLHGLARVVRLKSGTLPYGITGFSQVAKDGSVTVAVLDVVYDQTVGHELGHLWFAGDNVALDEGRAELVGRCVQRARGVPVGPEVVPGSWTMPDLLRFRGVDDAKGLEALVAGYEGSRKLFVALATLVPTQALLDPSLRYWADVRRVVSASGERGAWVMAELTRGVEAQRELFADPDDDGAMTLVERLAGTDPTNRDTDGDGWIDGKPGDVPADALPLLGDGVPTCLPASVAGGERRAMQLTMMLADGQRVVDTDDLMGFLSGFKSTLLDHTLLAWYTTDAPAADAWHPPLCTASPDGTVLVSRPWSDGATPGVFRDESLSSMGKICADPTTTHRARPCAWVAEQYATMAEMNKAVSRALVDARRRAAETFKRPIPRVLIELNSEKDGVTFGESATRVGFDLESARGLHDDASARDLAEMAVVMAMAYDAGSIFYARDAWLAIAQDFATNPAAAEHMWWQADRDKVRFWHKRVENCRTGWAGVLARDCF